MYSHTQWSSKVRISIPVPSDTRSDDVEVKLTSTSVSVGIRGHRPLLKGKLLRAIVPAESDWRLVPPDGHRTGQPTSRSSSSERAGGPSGPGSGSSEGGPSSDLASSTSSLVKISGAHSKAHSQASDDSSPVLIDRPHSFGSSPSPPAGQVRYEGASPSSPSPVTPASPTLFAEYRTSSTSSASEEGYSSPMHGETKMLIVELMKEEAAEWVGGLIIVGPFESDGEADHGWSGIDDVSLLGLAMEKLDSRRREEAEEMLSHLCTTNPTDPLINAILTTYVFPATMTPTHSALFLPDRLAKIYLHSAQHPSPLHTTPLPFPLPPPLYPIPTATSQVRAAHTLDPTLAIPPDLEHLLPSPASEKYPSSPGSSSSSSSSPSPTGTTSRRRRSKPSSTNRASGTRRPVPGGVPGGAGGEGDWSVWVAVTLVGVVLVLVAVWPGKGKAKGGTASGTGSSGAGVGV